MQQAAAPDQMEIEQLVQLFRTGQLDTAAARARELAARYPEFPFLPNILGAILCRQGKHAEGVPWLRTAVRLDPNSLEAWHNLSMAEQQVGQHDEAAASARAALRLQPGFAPALRTLGRASLSLGHLEPALESYRQAAALEPQNAVNHDRLGVALARLDRFDEAKASYERALAANPSYANAHRNLTEMLEQLNLDDELRAAVARAKQHCPSAPAIVLAEAKLLARDGDYAGARAIAEATPSTDQDAVLLSSRGFLLGSACDRLGDFDAAFEYFRQANLHYLVTPDARRSDGQRYMERLETLSRYFTPEWVATWRAIRIEDERPDPVFMVGFPRSGTTLLDTILLSHSVVTVVEEAPAMVRVRQELEKLDGGEPGALATLDDKQVAGLRDIYFGEIDAHAGQRQPGGLLVDKLPLNMVAAGTIHRLFPRARFIFSQRHPCDAVLSCFMQMFGPNDAMVNFADLERTAAVYAMAMDLWHRYQEMFRLQVHPVKYEDLVATFEETLHPLLAFLGLGWEDSLREFTTTARERGRINTPSYSQVIQPLYQRARGRWERYRKHLEPVLPTLLPWAARLGYEDSDGQIVSATPQPIT